ncbi:MAG: hypothetical protein ACREFX_05655 [Opitutaceae bacterium]
MNKTLLLIIIDFLFLNLIALTRWEKVEPARAPLAPVPTSGAHAPTAEQDLMGAMRQQLADEASARQALEQKLTRAGTTLTARERALGDLSGIRTRLEAQLAQAQLGQNELAQAVHAAHEESTLTRQQIDQLERELDERRAETGRQRRELSKLRAAQASAHRQIEGLTLAVVVDEAEKRNLQQQAAQLQTQVQTERAERAQVQASAEKLAQGVGQLAQNSGELTREIRADRPINANLLYGEFLANRVKTSFTATRRGLFGQAVNRSKVTPTVFVTDGKRVYALLHIDDTVFSVYEPNTNWERISVRFERPPSYDSRAGSLRFLAADPRIVAIPVEASQAAALGAKVYRLAADPFKFPDAVLIGAGKGYGELSFKLDPTEPGYVRVDNHLFRRLLGDFSPSRGDLVISHAGEVLGMMVNRDYCVLLKDFTAFASLPTGDQPATSPSGPILDRVAARIQAMPLPLQ